MARSFPEPNVRDLRCFLAIGLLLHGCLNWQSKSGGHGAGEDAPEVLSSDAGARDGAPDANGTPAFVAEEDAGQDMPADAAVDDDAGELPGDAGADAAPPAPCPQSACPDVFACEGTANDFICRGQFAEFPIPSRRSGQNFADQKLVVDVDGGVVLDQVSGLMWSRNVYQASITHAEAVQYCIDLVLGPYDDFRLPSIHEYLTMFGGEIAPDLDGRAFPGAATTYGWWSATPFVEADRPSFYSMAYTDYAYAPWPTDDTQGAQCVRTHARPIAVHDTPATRFVKQADDNVVHDTHTGLVWERALVDARAALTYPLARDYCSKLRYLGLTFRVPTLAELVSIMDFSKPLGQRFSDPFSNRARVTWTRTAYDGGDGLARIWQLHEEGWIGRSTVGDTDQAGVRCVATAP